MSVSEKRISPVTPSSLNGPKLVTGSHTLQRDSNTPQHGYRDAARSTVKTGMSVKHRLRVTCKNSEANRVPSPYQWS